MVVEPVTFSKPGFNSSMNKKNPLHQKGAADFLRPQRESGFRLTAPTTSSRTHYVGTRARSKPYGFSFS